MPLTVRLGPVTTGVHFAAAEPSETEVEPQEHQSICLTHSGHTRTPRCGKKGTRPLEAMGSCSRKNTFQPAGQPNKTLTISSLLHLPHIYRQEIDLTLLLPLSLSIGFLPPFCRSCSLKANPLLTFHHITGQLPGHSLKYIEGSQYFSSLPLSCPNIADNLNTFISEPSNPSAA